MPASTPSLTAAISEYCDAVIVGRAFVKTIGKKGKTTEMLEVNP